MDKLKLQDLDVSGKKVLMRVDYNVPMNKDGSIADPSRIVESLPSIQRILSGGGGVILMSHMGRPKGQREMRFSLAPCAKELSTLLGQPVQMAPDCIGAEVEKMVQNIKPKDVLLLENLRFYPAEEDPSLDPSFAEKLSRLGEIYINDAFGTAHRKHSSTALIASFFPGRAAAGLLMQKEIAFLGTLLADPKRPFYAVIGGSKVSTKLGILHSLIPKTDGIFIGGGMAFTFLKAQGISIGKSLCEEEQIPVAKAFLKSCEEKGVKLYLPKDIVIADAFSENAQKQIIEVEKGIPDDWMGMDIGPATTGEWSKALQSAATVFWNGPLGVFEFARFASGTHAIAETIASVSGVTVVGGGDSAAAIHQLHLEERFTHISTGGGASLEYIEFGHLPGIDALSNSN